MTVPRKVRIRSSQVTSIDLTHSTASRCEGSRIVRSTKLLSAPSLLPSLPVFYRGQATVGRTRTCQSHWPVFDQRTFRAQSPVYLEVCIFPLKNNTTIFCLLFVRFSCHLGSIGDDVWTQIIKSISFAFSLDSFEGRRFANGFLTTCMERAVCRGCIILASTVHVGR